MKTSKKVSLIVAIVLLLGIAGGLCTALVFGINKGGFSGFSFDTGQSDNLALDKQFKLEDIKHIYSESDTANIEVLKDDDANSKEVKVKIYAEDTEIVSAEQENENLKISIKSKNCHVFCINLKSSKIEIVLPENYDGSFNIKNDTGNITADAFMNASFTIDTDTGNKKFNGAKYLTIDSDTGNIEIGTVEFLDIDKDTGNLTIDKCTGKLAIVSDTGNISIDTLDLKENSTIDKDTGNLLINNAGNVYVNTQIDVGNQDITGGDRKSDIELKIKSDVGNITIH